MSTASRFEGRVALVTGAGSGIGRATAERLAAEGAYVGCLDRDADAAAETTALIVAAMSAGAGVGAADTAGAPPGAADTAGVAGVGAADTAGVAGVGAADTAGVGATAIVCDVTDPDGVEAAFQQLEASAGIPDVVCNVAGIGGFSHTHDTTDAEWARMIAVNLTGTFLVCRAALRRWQQLIEADPKRYRLRYSQPEYVPPPRPAIVNVASSAGLMGQPYSAAYCASKGGVVQLTRALAVEYLEAGFRVNAVAPGGVDTPLITSFMPPEDSSPALIARMVSPFGFASPAVIASMLVYLASEECGPTTGAIVPVDGGLTC